MSNNNKSKSKSNGGKGPSKKRLVVVDGIAVTVDRDAFDDIELLEALDSVRLGEVTRLGFVIERVFGADQKKRVYDALREDGRVRASSAADFFAKVMVEANAKN